MFKRTYKNINLSCIMQQDSENSKEKCLNGVMSKTRDGFLFEQAVRKGGCKRNPKLFEGDYCSLVHQRDGKYKIHMKTIDASTITNYQSFAFSLYCELLNALSIVSL